MINNFNNFRMNDAAQSKITGGAITPCKLAAPYACDNEYGGGNDPGTEEFSDCMKDVYKTCDELQS